MKLKNLFGFGNGATATNPKRQAMQDRIATAAGCRELAQSLQAQLNTVVPGSGEAILLRRQLQEVNRLLQFFDLQQERARVASVIKRDQEEASKALKAAESSLKAASDAWSGVDRDRLECQREIDRLNQELAGVIGEADKGVADAEESFRQVMGGANQNADAEAKAFDALRQAKSHRQTCGEFWEHRLTLRRDQLRTIEVELAKAEARKAGAQDAADQASMALVAIEYDRAAQQLIDAVVQIHAVRSQAPGAYLLHRATALPALAVASVERIVLGDQLVNDQQRVMGHAAQKLAQLEKPADLDLLTREANTEVDAITVEETDGVGLACDDLAPMET